MAPELSTYSQEFNYPARAKPSRPRPTSAHRRNNPHPRPDFLLPRKLQTEHGQRPMFPAITHPNKVHLYPSVRHISVQCPDGKVPPQTQPVLNSSHTDSKAAMGGEMPPAGWLSKPQLTDTASAQQAWGSGRNLQRKVSSSIPPIRPSKPELTYSRPRSKSTSDPSGYSCFHVVKPYKAGYYIIHPEFMSEWLH